MIVDFEKKEIEYLTELLDSQIGDEGDFHDNLKDIAKLEFNDQTLMVMRIIKKLLNTNGVEKNFRI